MEATGPKLIDLLYRAWSEPFTTKSDFAREYADLIGMAASDGLITTRQATGLYGNKWLITAPGLKTLDLLEGGGA
jgi:hypothetical protein